MNRGTYYPLGHGADMSEGERMALEAMDCEFDEPEDPDQLEEQRAADRLDHIDAPAGIWNATVGPVKITTMGDEHLKNALAWLERYDLENTEKAVELRAEQARRMTLPPGRALDLDMFNDAEPYRLVRRLRQAAAKIGVRIVGDGYVVLVDKDMAKALAKAVNDALPKGATIKLKGIALWALAPFEKPKPLEREPF